MDVPQTRYAKAPDGTSIAYQDLVFGGAGERELRGVPDRWRLDRVAAR